jgi:membrane dipeptidase
MLGSAAAQALHAEHPAIDLHADTLLWARSWGYDLRERHEPPLPRAAWAGHVDLPRMREGGMGAQFFGLVTGMSTALAIAHVPVLKGAGNGLARIIHEQIDTLDAVIARAPAELRLVRTAAEVEACRREGVLGALLGIEGAHSLEGNLDNLDAFAKRGLRYLGLLHFGANEAGHPAWGRGRDDDKGLTPWGRQLVARCEQLGVIVDLAHINRRGFMEACEMATRPPIVSHTGVLGAFEHWRNIDDAQLRAVADRGGCIGVIFCPRFLGASGIEAVVRHMKHILDVVGEDAPALGSDWDGVIVPTTGLADPRGLPLLTDALLQAGVSERTVGKILRENVMRVLA